MHDIVFDKSFDLENTKEYILSIQVSLDGFSFLVLNQQEKKILVLKSVNLKISSDTFIARRFEEWILSEELLKRPFSRITITFFSEKFTVIPKAYFLAEKKNELISTLFENESKLEIKENNIDTISSLLLYTIPPELSKVLKKNFEKFEINHPVYTLIRRSFKNNNNIVLLFDARSFHLIIVHEGKLLLANNYKTTNASDIVFYTLSALKQSKISPSGLDLHLAGKTDLKKEKVLAFTPYFKTTSFLTSSVIYTEEVVQQHTLHHYISLLA